MIGKEIYEKIARLKGGDADSLLQGRLLSLILLISKLPSDVEHGIVATEAFLADLLLEHLSEGKHELRARIPALMQGLVDNGDLLPMSTSAGVEYRLQTVESQQWHETFRQQQNDLRGNPQQLDAFRSQEIQNYIRKQMAQAHIVQGVTHESRTIKLCFDSDLPADANSSLYAHVLEGDEKAFTAAVRGASHDQSTLFIYVPSMHRSELLSAIVDYKAAETTLEVSGMPTTDAGKDARAAMAHRQKSAEDSKRGILKEIFDGIQVQLAGGAEVLGNTLTEKLENGGKKACERLYSEFKVADVKGWGTVYKHPLCHAIKRFIGVMKTGADIRQHFTAAPYGWSKDAIEGAVYTMLAAGILKAADTQEHAVDAKSLERAKFGQTKFRPETVTISKIQLIKVRSLINAMGVPCAAGEEQSKLGQALIEAQRIARSAGGDAPLPLPPQSAILNNLATLSGNDQLIEAFTQHQALITEVEQWKTLAEKSATRQQQWHELNTAVKHCQGLSGASTLTSERQAVIDNRSLLAEPSPVEPLLRDAIDMIRVAITAKYDAFEQEFTECLLDLQADSTWQKLPPARQQALLADHQLKALTLAALDSHDRVIDCIENTSLAQWSDKTSALPGRFERVRQAAITELEPKVQNVSLPRGKLIRTEADLEAWLQQVRAEALASLAQGPVSFR